MFNTKYVANRFTHLRVASEIVGSNLITNVSGGNFCEVITETCLPHGC